VGVTRSTRARATRLRRLQQATPWGVQLLVWPQPRRLRTQPRSTAPAPRRTLIIASPVLRNSPRRAELWRIGIPEACRAPAARGRLVSARTRSGRLFGAYQEGDSRLRLRFIIRSDFRAHTEWCENFVAPNYARGPVSVPTRKPLEFAVHTPGRPVARFPRPCGRGWRGCGASRERWQISAPTRKVGQSSCAG